MNKKYLIVIVVTVVAAAVFFISKSHRNEKEIKSHESQQYERMIEVANKSAMAGMSHMGRALNKYREEKGVYPDKLSDLYPDYIPAKDFLEKIRWSYEPGKKDFFLRKTYQNSNDRVLTSAIRSDLRLQQHPTLASSGVPTQAPALSATKPAHYKLGERITQASGTLSPRVVEAGDTDSGSSHLQTTSAMPVASGESLLMQKVSFPELELVSTAQPDESEQFLERVKGDLLVWKSKGDGTLGFGNVQYPEFEEMLIYDQGEWIQLRHCKSNSETKRTTLQATTGTEKTSGRLAAAYSKPLSGLE